MTTDNLLCHIRFYLLLAYFTHLSLLPEVDKYVCITSFIRWKVTFNTLAWNTSFFIPVCVCSKLALCWILKISLVTSSMTSHCTHTGTTHHILKSAQRGVCHCWLHIITHDPSVIFSPTINEMAIFFTNFELNDPTHFTHSRLKKDPLPSLLDTHTSSIVEFKPPPHPNSSSPSNEGDTKFPARRQ